MYYWKFVLEMNTVLTTSKFTEKEIKFPGDRLSEKIPFRYNINIMYIKRVCFHYMSCAVD